MNRVVDSEVSSVHRIGLGSLSALHSQQLIVRIREWSHCNQHTMLLAPCGSEVLGCHPVNGILFMATVGSVTAAMANAQTSWPQLAGIPSSTQIELYGPRLKGYAVAISETNQ